MCYDDLRGEKVIEVLLPGSYHSERSDYSRDVTVRTDCVPLSVEYLHTIAAHGGGDWYDTVLGYVQVRVTRADRIRDPGLNSVDEITLYYK